MRGMPLAHGAAGLWPVEGTLKVKRSPVINSSSPVTQNLIESPGSLSWQLAIKIILHLFELSLKKMLLRLFPYNTYGLISPDIQIYDGAPGS